MTGIDSDAVAVLHATDAALEMILELRSSEDDGESLALWVEVTGTSGDSFTYDMYFQAVSDAIPDDWSGERGGLALVVPARSIAKVRGSVLDVSPDEGQGGMVIENPNQPPRPAAASPAMAGPPVDLSGDVAQRVLQVLEQQINPSIAAHGGRADLVAVQDGVAYLRLSGGCAGCGMAAVTLSQGIEVALRESVDEITRIVDVTDHAAGTNPYYEPAKK
jgi:Fe/S biogenesis protein NfuA